MKTKYAKEENKRMKEQRGSSVRRGESRKRRDNFEYSSKKNSNDRFSYRQPERPAPDQERNHERREVSLIGNG